jgi:LAO/AO transport system kinase
VAALLGQIRATGRRVAVLAVDPSSPISGGAVLGDRIRMMDRHADDGVFVRSMASRGRQGGLAWATAGLVHLLDAAGYPLILVETVGTGQDGTDIASLADTVVVVEAPGLGDGVQAIKSGLLEVGDIVVVNKADQPGAEEALRLLRTSLDLAHAIDGRLVPVLPTVSIGGSGIPELLTAIDDHDTWLTESNQRATRRERAARAEVSAGLRAALDRRLEAGPGRSRELAALIARVARRDLSPRQAVNALAVALDPPDSGRPIRD